MKFLILIGYAALEVSVTGNTRSDMPGSGEWDCEELETRLLEGALQNLQYFPQLIKEVQLQNQGTHFTAKYRNHGKYGQLFYC